MKGITPVVAIILLLLITIAIVGFAFGYFSQIMTTTGTAAQAQADATTQMLAKSVRIEAASGSALSVRNIGSATMNFSSEIAVYISSVPVTTCNWQAAITSGGMVAAGSSSNCTLNPTCAAGAKIKVTAPAGSVEGTCPV